MQIISTRNSVDGNLPASVNAVWGLTNSDMVIATCNTERMRITSGGNVGIGTCSPSYLLHAYSTDASAARIYLQGTSNFVTTQFGNTGGTFYLGIDDSAGANFTGTAYARFLYSSGAYPIAITTNGVERMRITATGNIGIGATPCAWAAPTAGKVIQLGNRASLFSYNTNTLDLATNFYFDGGDYRYIQSAYATLLRSDSSDGTFVFYNAASGTAGGVVSLNERMRITSAGNVKIGACAIAASSSNAALQVAGAIRFGNPDGDYVQSYGGGISARTLSTFAPGSFAILVKGLGGSGFLYQVQGFTLTGVRFTDLLFGINNTFSVIATTGEGSPAARAYTITSENLNICIGGSATYSAIVAHGFGAVER